MPIFCPAIADSSIGMGLSQARHRDAGAGQIDVIGDIVESANLVSAARGPRRSSSAAARRRTSSTRRACRRSSTTTAVGGHRYALQIVTDVPHFGGASGSSLEEAQSWGKLATDAEQVTVQADATIALPLLASALAASAPRLLARRKPPAFDPVRPASMTVNGRPFPIRIASRQ